MADCNVCGSKKICSSNIFFTTDWPRCVFLEALEIHVMHMHTYTHMLLNTKCIQSFWKYIFVLIKVGWRSILFSLTLLYLSHSLSHFHQSSIFYHVQDTKSVLGNNSERGFSCYKVIKIEVEITLRFECYKGNSTKLICTKIGWLMENWN